MLALVGLIKMVERHGQSEEEVTQSDLGASGKAGSRHNDLSWSPELVQVRRREGRPRGRTPRAQAEKQE